MDNEIYISGKLKYLTSSGNFNMEINSTNLNISDGINPVTNNIQIDDELSLTSTNPVENRVISNELSNKAEKDHIHSIMIGSSANSMGSSGLVPAPSKGSQNKFLRGDGSWSEIVTMSACNENENGSSGLVPAPSKGSQNKFLRGDGSWSEIPKNTTYIMTTQPYVEDYIEIYGEHDPSDGFISNIVLQVYDNIDVDDIIIGTHTVETISTEEVQTNGN